MSQRSDSSRLSSRGAVPGRTDLAGGQRGLVHQGIPGLRSQMHRGVHSRPASAGGAMQAAQDTPGGGARPGVWAPPKHGWVAHPQHFKSRTHGDSEAKSRKGVAFTITTAEIWAAYQHMSQGGRPRALSKEELLEAFRLASAIDLDPQEVERMLAARLPSGEPKYPDGRLPYDRFIHEIQCLAPYAGDDAGAYVHKIHQTNLAHVAEMQGRKNQAQAKVDEAKARARANKPAAKEALAGSSAPQADVAFASQRSHTPRSVREERYYREVAAQQAAQQSLLQ